MSSYHDQVARVVRAVAFHRPLTYSWLGRRVPPLPADLRKRLPAATVRVHVLHTLRFQLYRDFYCQGGVPTRREAPPPAPAGYTPLAERLAQANAGKGSGLPGAADRPKGLFNISPGYYMAYGDATATASPPGPLLRLYWNVDPDGAVHLFEQLTRGLNDLGVPFQLKALNSPAAYTRADAAVLYVPGVHFCAVRTLLAHTYRAVCTHLGPAVPALTLPLAPGLGLAEDPGPAESFGLHRCGLLAEALLQAHEEGAATEAAQLEAVSQRFAAAGIALERPYLGPGSAGGYALRIPATRRAPRRQVAASGDFAGVALAIGRRLAGEAIWHAGRCTWIGADLVEAAPALEVPYRTLGPDLYAGTAGVGLFLVELWRVTGESWARDTGRAALRQALARADMIPPADRLGLYTGWAGLALAAVRAGRLLADAELEAAGWDLARRCPAGRAPGAYDLLGGRAGTILALLALAADGDRALLATAVELGDELLAAATRSAAGWTWAPPAALPGPGLTGFSHGAAGIGYALLELWSATDETRFRTAAEQAFRYEQRWFDSTRGNWADLRERAGRRDRPRAFAAAWCHGAPGIAISRLRAAELLPAGAYPAEARVALETTRQASTGALAQPRADFSLCHGLAGLAEVLAVGAGGPGQAQALGRAARAIAEAGVARYADGSGPWPGGALGDTPALLVGLAGIGLFYLRRHDPDTPSPLLPLTLTLPAVAR